MNHRDFLVKFSPLQDDSDTGNLEIPLDFLEVWKNYDNIKIDNELGIIDIEYKARNYIFTVEFIKDLQNIFSVLSVEMKQLIDYSGTQKSNNFIL